MPRSDFTIHEVRRMVPPPFPGSIRQPYESVTYEVRQKGEWVRTFFSAEGCEHWIARQVAKEEARAAKEKA